MTVPCGKCLGCLQRKRADWTQRISYEEKICRSSAFVTLTYDDFSVPVTDNGNLTLSKKDLQKYCKRVYTPGMRFFAVGEYGSKTFRPHYHLAVFNSDVDRLYDKWAIRGERLGNVKMGEVNPASIHYLTKYLVNEDSYKDYLDAQKPFRLMSKGLGNGLQGDIRGYCINNMSNIVPVGGGNKSLLPRYISDKIFTKAQKFEIAEKAIQEMDKKRDQDFSILVKHRDYLTEIARKTSKSNKC